MEVLELPTIMKMTQIINFFKLERSDLLRILMQMEIKMVLMKLMIKETFSGEMEMIEITMNKMQVRKEMMGMMEMDQLFLMDLEEESNTTINMNLINSFSILSLRSLQIKESEILRSKF